MRQVSFWWVRRVVRPRVVRLLLARKNNDLESVFITLRQIRRWAGLTGVWWTAILLTRVITCGGPDLADDEYAGFQLQRMGDDGEFEDVDVESVPATLRAYGRFTTAVINRDLAMTQTVWAELDRVEENIVLVELLDGAWGHIARSHDGMMPDNLG